MPRRRDVQRFRVAAILFTASLLLAACASPVSTRTSVVGKEDACDSTRLNVAFVSDGDAATKEKVVESARHVEAILASETFRQACEATEMNRTQGQSVAEVCRQLACAGPRTIKVGLYSDAGMRALAFEKSGVVFFNIAKSRAGSPKNFAHEFAHVLGYSHVTYWGLRRKNSVPYVVGRIVAGMLASETRAQGLQGAEASSVDDFGDP